MSISNHLNKIKNAVFGKDVRGAIHDAIKQCYDDASVNHDNANMEVKLARGPHNTLNDRLNNSDQNLAQTNAQLSASIEEIKKKSTINPFDFGAKGDGVSDDTKSLQDMFIFAYRNRKSIFITKGTYLIKKPLVVIVSSNELQSALTITGEGVEHTIITCAEDFSAHLSEGQLSTKSAFIIANDTFLNDDDTFVNGTGNSHSVHMSGLFIRTYNENKNIDYGIYTACAHASSKYSMLHIRGFVEAGIKNGASFYLNILEKIRVDNSKISFNLRNGTSIKLDSCYSVMATDTAYKINNLVYSTMINCCADGCTGVVFDLTGMQGGTIIGPGAESEYCKTTFLLSNRTDVVVIGGLLWGNYDSEDYVCIDASGNAVAEFRNVVLAYDKTEGGRTLTGCLLKQHARSKITLTNCSFPYYEGEDDYPLDPWQRTKITDLNGSFNSRNRDILNYVGYDTNGYHENGDRVKYKNAQAIYFGKGLTDSVLADGRDVAWYKPFNVGDIFMTKKPYETLSMGNCCVSNGSRIGDAKYYGIPLTVSMSTAELQSFDDTNVRVGTEVFNTTLGKPVWKKTNGVWVTADGTRI